MKTLIRYWLHEEPEEDIKEFTAQAARAQWMEGRYFENLGKIFKGN